MKNYSKQREAILSYVRSVRTHPTAKDVYSAVREQLPNISLGTVYRNLSELLSDGEIISVNVGDGFEHYDCERSYHIHLHCNKCGEIIDIDASESGLFSLAEKSGFKSENAVTVINGLCKNCAKQ